MGRDCRRSLYSDPINYRIERDNKMTKKDLQELVKKSSTIQDQDRQKMETIERIEKECYEAASKGLNGCVISNLPIHWDRLRFIVESYFNSVGCYHIGDSGTGEAIFMWWG